jgi:hypothetical protein
MDSRKCQTLTATPAKPGELPVGLDWIVGTAWRMPCTLSEGSDHGDRKGGRRHDLRYTHDILPDR